MTTRQDAKLSKVERIAIGGAVAPIVRRAADLPRKVTLVGKDGKPVGVTTSTEVAMSLLARSEIEFSVQEGKRPAYVKCKTCGRPVKVPKFGTIKYCVPRTHHCVDCGKPLMRRGMCQSGKRCLRCTSREKCNAMKRATTSEERSAVRRSAHANRSPLERRKTAETSWKTRRMKLGHPSDEQIRAVLVNARSWGDAANTLDVSRTLVRNRAKKLGVVPGARR